MEVTKIEFLKEIDGYFQSNPELVGKKFELSYEETKCPCMMGFSDTGNALVEEVDIKKIISIALSKN